MTGPMSPYGAHAEIDPSRPEPERGASPGSVGELVGNLSRDLSTLMRQELALARAEIRQEVTTTGKAAGALGGAGLAAWFVVLFLSVALWAGLSNVMDPGWAALIVAVLWAVIAAVLAATGRAKLRQVHPKPERTVETLGRVPDALRGNVPDAPRGDRGGMQ